MADTPPVLVTPAGALARLNAGLTEYARLRGGLDSAILRQAGAQLIYGNGNPKYGAVFPGLIDLYKDQVPGQGTIFAAARRRGFRVGRRVLGGALSPKAIERARGMMGGFKTILASVNPDTGALRIERRGARGRRVHFRKGRTSYAIDGRGPLKANERRMNLRAVATFYELLLREGGRNFLASSWMFKRWRKLAQTDPRRAPGVWRVLVNQNPRSSVQPLGAAQLSGTEESGNMELRITSYVPGVRGIGEGRGLFVRALEGVRADRAAYVARKHREALEGALRTGRFPL